MLQSDPNIAVDNDRVKFRQQIDCGYNVHVGIVAGKEQRYFQVKLSYSGDETNISLYTDLLRSIKGVIHQAGVQPQTLWDDVSSYYANQAYPLIHKTENLMRKLIAYFMLTNVGKDWVNEASPTAVKDAIDKSKRREYLDVLHQIDFIHLGDFLFKSYQDKNVADLYDMLENAARIEDLDLAELKNYRGKSNWERYFSKVVACEDDYLNKRWGQLYDLRCAIAHNALVGKADYDRINQLVAEITVHLQKAIDNLDKVHVPKEEKDVIAENAVASVSTLSGEFIQLYKTFQAKAISIVTESGQKQLNSPAPVHFLLRELHTNGILDEGLYEQANEIRYFRNRLIHDATAAFNEEEIQYSITKLKLLIKAITRSWKNEIVAALQDLGNQASLQSIYKYIEENTSRELPENWHAVIRKTLQVHCSESRSYAGGDDLFRQLGDGVWGLKVPEAH
jgi:hypothetical protein